MRSLQAAEHLCEVSIFFMLIDLKQRLDCRGRRYISIPIVKVGVKIARKHPSRLDEGARAVCCRKHEPLPARDETQVLGNQQTLAECSLQVWEMVLSIFELLFGEHMRQIWDELHPQIVCTRNETRIVHVNDQGFPVHGVSFQLLSRTEIGFAIAYSLPRRKTEKLYAVANM